MFIETSYKAILAEDAKLPLETVDKSSAQQTVSVLTKAVDALNFDELVVTTPLGWLKCNKQLFDPPLPSRLEARIAGISRGHLENVYITFPEVFWATLPSGTDESELKPSDRLALSEDTFAGYTSWLSPSYSVTTKLTNIPKKSGTSPLYRQLISTPAHHKPTLLFSTYGSCSVYLTSLVHHKSDEKYYELLGSFFKSYYSLLSNYSTSDPICTPKAILSTEGQRDELSGCRSYCSIQTGTKEADKDIEAVRNGVQERRLWFAGEHISPKKELGTAIGAYLNQEAVAQRI
ncbi:hypothetical protein BJ878DRAFT_565632 [Calycina marina]|uniref:Amine oxidase domain-containing protein n=1 Tax=Calycina marina TaxID=1763456 RepID=A0A9P7Z7F4_9HELO|nr:hypothetical protein BJ878DRAFT_565632 [Calycina marina]